LTLNSLIQLFGFNCLDKRLVVDEQMGRPIWAIEHGGFGPFETYSVPNAYRYTGFRGLPTGFEQASDLCLGAFAESENRP